MPPYIQQALRDLNIHFINGPIRRDCAHILTTHSKSAKTSQRINFLTECRRRGIWPDFIDNATKQVSRPLPTNTAVHQRTTNLKKMSPK